MRAAASLIGAALALGLSEAQAGIINGGFEANLTAWESIGDVSIQTAAIGISPTQGQKQVVLTTLCSTGCNGAAEFPYSGTSALAIQPVADFLGIQSGDKPVANVFADIVGITPRLGENQFFGPHGENSGIRTLFHGTAGNTIRFDWDFVSVDGADAAYFTLWSADEEDDFFAADTLHFGLPPNLSGMDLNPQMNVPECPQPCLTTRETGYATGSIQIPFTGWFYLGFGVSDSPEGTAPSALLLDNVRLVPEPCSAIAIVGAMLLVAGSWRRKSTQRRSSCYYSPGIALAAVMLFGLSSDPARAGIINGGFEAGLVGWQTLGDVSTQNAAIGVEPTQGRNQLVLTTLCSSTCDNGGPEYPYSGTSAVLGGAFVTAPFLGIPTEEIHLKILTNALYGEGSAAKALFYAHGGSRIEFDWNGVSIGPDGDSAFSVLAAADPSIDYKDAGLLFHSGFAGLTHFESDMDLKDRSFVYTQACELYGYCAPSHETGYRHASVVVPFSG